MGKLIRNNSKRKQVPGVDARATATLIDPRKVQIFSQIFWEMYQVQFALILKGFMYPMQNAKFFINSTPG